MKYVDPTRLRKAVYEESLSALRPSAEPWGSLWSAMAVITPFVSVWSCMSWGAEWRIEPQSAPQSPAIGFLLNIAPLKFSDFIYTCWLLWLPGSWLWLCICSWSAYFWSKVPKLCLPYPYFWRFCNDFWSNCHTISVSLPPSSKVCQELGWFGLDLLFDVTCLLMFLNY